MFVASNIPTNKVLDTTYDAPLESSGQTIWLGKELRLYLPGHLLIVLLHEQRSILQ